MVSLCGYVTSGVVGSLRRKARVGCSCSLSVTLTFSFKIVFKLELIIIGQKYLDGKRAKLLISCHDHGKIMELGDGLFSSLRKLRLNGSEAAGPTSPSLFHSFSLEAQPVVLHP